MLYIQRERDHSPQSHHALFLESNVLKVPAGGWGEVSPAGKGGEGEVLAGEEGSDEEGSEEEGSEAEKEGRTEKGSWGISVLYKDTYVLLVEETWEGN